MKINFGPRNKNDLQDIDYLYENYTPAKNKLTYTRLPKKSTGEYRWILQLLVSGAIFLAVFGLFKANIPFTGTLKNGVKYLLTAEINLRPALHQVVQLAVQAGNLELPLDDLPVPVQTVVTPESKGNVQLLPVSGNVAGTYGWQVDPQDNTLSFHEGVDVETPAGTGVKASADGKVIAVGEKSGLGRYVLVKNTTGELVRYADLSKVLVQKEQQVKAGDTIAETGTSATGASALHWEVIVDGKPVDPLAHLGIDITKSDNVGKTDAR